MSNKKPIPMVVTPARKLCPVCHKASYSASGVHPQCALRTNELLARPAKATVEPGR